MANEIQYAGRLTFAKNNSWAELATSLLQATMSGEQFIRHRQSVGTSEEALVLGDVSAPFWFLGVNRDGTNFINVRSGTGATDFLRIPAGGSCGPVLIETSAPFVIADTGACELDYLLIEA